MEKRKRDTEGKRKREETMCTGQKQYPGFVLKRPLALSSILSRNSITTAIFTVACYRSSDNMNIFSIICVKVLSFLHFPLSSPSLLTCPKDKVSVTEIQCKREDCPVYKCIREVEGSGFFNKTQNKLVLSTFA